jgi:hypothetical protein
MLLPQIMMPVRLTLTVAIAILRAVVDLNLTAFFAVAGFRNVGG